MPATERPFNKYSLPGRLKPLSERRPAVTLTSWETISKKLELMTHNNHDGDNRKLIRANRALLKEIYEAWYNVAAGKGRERLDELTRKYDTDENSPDYNPKLLDNLAPFTTIIRDSFPNIASKRR